MAVTIPDDCEHGPHEEGVPNYNVMAPKLIGSMEFGSLWRPPRTLFTKKHAEFGLPSRKKAVIAIRIERTLRESWLLRPAVKGV